MTITPAIFPRYLYNQDTSVAFTGFPIRIDTLNMPYFSMLLGSDNTATGTLTLEEAVSADGNAGAVFAPLVWIPVYTIAIAAGLFTATGEKYYAFPNSDSATITSVVGPWLTAAEAIRLSYAPASGGAAGQLNVAYFGKSFG
jgi:hypothetical protein